MRKILIFINLIIFLFIGCGENNLSKEQYYEKGLGFIENKKPNGAIIAFKKAIKEDPDYFEARYQLASAYILTGKHESAERELLKVLLLSPSFIDTHILLAKTYLNTGKIENAISEINIYLQEKDDNPEAFEIAASAYFMKKEYGKAEEILIESIKNYPDRIPSNRFPRATHQ